LRRTNFAVMSKKGRPPTPEVKAATEVLSDGEYHPVSEILLVMMKEISPSRALRIRKDAKSRVTDLDDKIRYKTREMAIARLNTNAFHVVDEEGVKVKISSKREISSLRVRLITEEERVASYRTPAREEAARKLAEKQRKEELEKVTDERALKQVSKAGKEAILVRHLIEPVEFNDLGPSYLVFYMTAAKNNPSEVGYLVRLKGEGLAVYPTWPNEKDPEFYESANKFAQSKWRFVVNNPSQGEK